ncbi:hypothetical protein DRQ36_09560 [bacterium]|nr:MAG: hypothetical protein DRQ36_09560 [bacterium]
MVKENEIRVSRKFELCRMGYYSTQSILKTANLAAKPGWHAPCGVRRSSFMFCAFSLGFGKPLIMFIFGIAGERTDSHPGRDTALAPARKRYIELSDFRFGRNDVEH